MCLASIIVLIFTSPSGALGAMLSGAQNGITLTLKMLAIYTIWLSVLKIIEKGGLNKFFAAIFRPLTKRLFKNESKEAQECISMNFSANFLGMGGAATPLGIRAMELMQDGSETATDNMIMFMVINATSIQLLPTTIIALRQGAGSLSSGDIILPSLIATLITTATGILIVKLISSKKK